MVMNAGERGLSRSNLTDTWYFYFLSSICEKAAHLFGWVDRRRIESNFLFSICEMASHIFRFADRGRVAVGVESGLANGGRS